MGRVSDFLIDTTNAVMKIVGIPNDDPECENFEKVSEWILENVNLHEFRDNNVIADHFRKYMMCPQCLTITDGKPCMCYQLELV